MANRDALKRIDINFLWSFDQLSNYHSSAEPPKKLISIDTFGGNISNKCRHDFDHNKAWWPDFNLDFLEGDSLSAVQCPQ